MTAELGGVVAPIITPTDERGRFVAGAMETLVDRLIDDLDAVFVRGTSGEYAALTDEDADAALRTVVGAVDGRVPVIVGVGDTSTPRTLQRLEAAADSGARYATVTTTFYFAAGESESLHHFSTVADRSALPVLIYHIPQNTHSSLRVPVITELAQHPNIVGMKDSSGDFFTFQEILAARPEGFVVFQGREQLAAASLLAGADGVISALANIDPALLGRLRDAARAGDASSAHELQRQVTEHARMFDPPNWLAALKAALEEMGVPVGPPVPPLEPVTADARARLRERLGAAGLPVAEVSSVE